MEKNDVIFKMINYFFICKSCLRKKIAQRLLLLLCVVARSF